ncbi:MAG: pantoate--beta-alanine ligase [Planctomycetota bacterium]|nr:pantoate--beta-alanine ligase [Planctomycetota bacterium]
MPIVTTIAELRQAVRRARAAGQRVGVVPTMGALHAGHLSLVQAASSECDFTVVTIFVNPTQFGPNEDFSRYPRRLDEDMQLLSGARTDLVFAPTTEEMYPAGECTTVEVTGITAPWEGEVRPHHFRGVSTVVAKLLNAVGADVAFFGQKDFQQAAVIRQMVADLNMPVEIRVCPTVRDSDGLALSSRNAYLSAEERRSALVIPQSLQKALRLVQEQGETSTALIERAMRETIETEPEIVIDYIAIVDSKTLTPRPIVGPGTEALVAARVGTTRLIDNMILRAE